jgi:BirA family transcriptional regulator, biotin operon repressor / biotin---[acetyl-CoA-carboxylase] ligase
VSDTLVPAVVRPLLRGRFGHDYRYVERTASTQRLLEGAEEGAVAVAEEQTEGRGRLGRSWHARSGTSVLVSIVLEPPVDAARLPELTLVASEACAEAIAAVAGLTPALKHPNDVLVDGRKVAGILAEARDGRITLGVGINVNAGEDELPTGTSPPAGSLAVAAGHPVDRAALLAELLVRLERRYDAWVAAASR